MTTCSNPQEKYKQNSWWNMTELYENHWKSTVETLGSTVSVGIIIIVSWDYIIVSCWLVVYLPLWKIWIRQLGLWHSQYMEKWKPCSKPPTRLALSSQILSWKSKKWLKPATHEETSKPHSPVKHLKAVNMETGMFLCNVRVLGNASTDLWKSMLGTFNYTLRTPFPKANLGLHNV